MIPELGHFALILALFLSFGQLLFPTLGVFLKNNSWQNSGPAWVTGQFLFVIVSFFSLMIAFVNNDFSVVYVAQNSNSQLPLFFRITALWGAHEGSVLLWITVLSFWTLIFSTCARNLPQDFRARVLAVLGFISFGFIVFLLFTSNPFARFLPYFPQDGADLNPLLQDVGLTIHPPMLYMGYVGLAVPFSMALSSLWAGKFDKDMARAMRPWVILPWCFLTLGITLGSWWSYRVLGWGGWWFWDPVENGSFLPWLVGTALIHSLIVSQKQDVLKNWSLLLALVGFSLCLTGTFLVRSGILISVHAFASDPTRGEFLLLFLSIVIGGAFLLYAVRGPMVMNTAQKGVIFSFLSRETFLLLNNVFLFSTLATILLGTLYPLILDVLGLEKISVGPPYFNTVFIPLMVPTLLLMGIAPFLAWRQNNIKNIGKSLWLPFLLTVTLLIVTLIKLWQTTDIYLILGLYLSLWVIFTTLTYVVRLYRRKEKVTHKHLGMIVAHLGVAVCALGITLTSHFSVLKEVSMQPGDEATVGAYTFHFIDVNNLQGPNYTGIVGEFLVTKDQQWITVLHPEKRLYNASQTGMTTPAIDAGLLQDLYLALGDPLSNKAWAVRIYVKPFIRWIWLGGLLILLGGLLAWYKTE